MRMAAGSVRPDGQARALADEMMSMDGVMREILDETIPTGDGEEVRESGRTLCGSSSEVRGPLARFPTAVELASCPVGAHGGTWHTHVTRDQLKRPSNSLPDTANVVFGEIDVSIVVGTQRSEAIVAAEDRQGAAQEFRDALGVDARTTDDVVEAIIDGQVRDPPDARRRVRHRLSSLFIESDTTFRDMDRRLEMSGVPAHSMVSFEMIDARHHAMVAQELRNGYRMRSHNKNPLRDPQGVREFTRQANTNVKRAASRAGVGQYAFQSAVAESVRLALRSFFR